MSEVPVWTCEFAPETEPLNNLTVGAKFIMQCKGDLPVEWSTAAPLTLQMPKEEDQYKLVLLKADQLEPTQARFVVTGYRPGQHDLDYIRILQGPKGFEVAHPKWQIQTVIKQDPSKPPEPFPEVGPWWVQVPIWFVVALALGFLLAVYVLVTRIRRHLQRKRMLEGLKLHRTALTPIHQFYREARQLRRRIHMAKQPEDLKPVVEDLNKEFRLFVLRQFEIPTLDWSNGEILRDLRKRHRPVFQETSAQVKKTLRELDRVKFQTTVSAKDLEQLHTMSLETAEKMVEPMTAKTSRGLR
jgi:hypothetical protein